MKQATDQVSQTFDFYALTVPERFQFGADAATIISGLIAIVAIGWAVRSHRTVLREQARLRAQELIISIAQSWNGNEMLPVRIEASQWLSDFPDDVDPIQWLADQGGDWTKIAVIAHFLVSVEMQDS
jgi:type II secretory pathway pseudopilin PulG